MKAVVYSLAFIIILGSALFGFLSMVFRQPISFVAELALILGMIAVVWFIVRHVHPATDQSRYRKAASRQSIQKKHRLTAYKRLRSIRASHLKVISSSNTFQRAGRLKTETVKEQNHLTVIEGKKSKKRNRLLF
ncbi:MAG: SA1362 family protein [Sporolactobacillus sp.]